MRRFLGRFVVFALVLVACGETTESTTSVGPPSTESPTPAVSTSVAPPATSPPTNTTTTTPMLGEYFSVYMFLDTASDEPGPFLAPLSRYGGGPVTPLEAAQMLMRGLAFTEVGIGLSTAVPMIPDPPDALSVAIDGTTATVDLTSIFETGGGGGTFLMTGRLAQVVFTLTQFDEIDAVLFEIEGAPATVFSSEGVVLDGPQTRSDFTAFMPNVLLEEPAVTAEVSFPLAVRGYARPADGIVQYALTDWDGLIVAEGSASVGPAELEDFGRFSVTIEIPSPGSGLGSVIVWLESPDDGSQQWVMEYPVVFAG